MWGEGWLVSGFRGDVGGGDLRPLWGGVWMVIVWCCGWEWSRFRRVDVTFGASWTLRVSRFAFNYIFCNISFTDYISKGSTVRRLYNPRRSPMFYIILPLFTTNPSSVETAAHNLRSSKSAFFLLIYIQ